ncbi:TPA: oligosaccharide repeat unit polymerase [Serratia marcescens]|uniref:Oligosaccharide repeat unit polymerase n=2 Tax=Serratia marcescens TaxID=615 RepID=A0AB33FSJ3_SERMA|nr:MULTISPECIES: O-antigen polymerase [Serratia]AKL40127.1 hypothetical protein AB188_05715 [Serratia marcescens]AWL67369.1 hypothetical protein DKC05_06655 [Serratia marcescens]MDP8604388.1 O-antigen polymerase [Serratia marcescens]MDP8872962.1 O-antigen polymerase [Serratia marcescens]UBI65159.1 oligosaccharide repeat unit polymerase [Serratia sp. HRI]
MGNNGILRHLPLAGFGIVCLICIILLPVNGVSKSFAIAAVANFVFFTYFFKNIYNPASIFMSMFLFMIGCSQAKLTLIEQDDFSHSTWMALFAVIACFYMVVATFVLRRGRITLNRETNVRSGIAARTLFWSNVICIVTEVFIYWYAIHKIGGIPLFDDNIRANIMPKVISNYLMTLMVLPTFFIIFNTIYVTESRKYGYLIFSCAYLSLLMLLGGRINIFIPVITSLFYVLIQYYVAKENKSALLITGIVTLFSVVLLMVSMPLVRTQIYVQNHQSSTEEKAQTGTHYYEAIYNSPNTNTQEHREEKDFKPTMKLPPQMMSIWINLSTEMHAFNKMVIYLDKTHDFRDGRMLMTGTFRFATKSFMPDETLDLVKMGGYDWINIMTFMQKPYMDFGVYGIGGFILIFTWIGMTLYQRVQQRKTLINTLLYSYFCMAMLFMIFDNHFYYSTVIVNIILLLLFKAFMSRDWLAKLKLTKQSTELKAAVHD